MIIHRFLLLLASLVMVLVSVVSAEISTCPDGKGGTRFQDTPCPGEGHYAAPPAAEPLSLALLRTVHPIVVDGVIHIHTAPRWEKLEKLGRPGMIVVEEVPSMLIPTARLDTMLFNTVGLAFCSTRMPVPAFKAEP